MFRRWSLLILLSLAALFLAACGGSETSTAAPSSGEEQAQEEISVEEDSVTADIDPEAIYTTLCARCHGADRSGGRGPALLPDRLTQDASVYQATITGGSGVMPSFSNRLSPDEISALVEFILSDPQ